MPLDSSEFLGKLIPYLTQDILIFNSKALKKLLDELWVNIVFSDVRHYSRPTHRQNIKNLSSLNHFLKFANKHLSECDEQMLEKIYKHAVKHTSLKFIGDEFMFKASTKEYPGFQFEEGERSIVLARLFPLLIYTLSESIDPILKEIAKSSVGMKPQRGRSKEIFREKVIKWTSSIFDHFQEWVNYKDQKSLILKKKLLFVRQFLTCINDEKGNEVAIPSNTELSRRLPKPVCFEKLQLNSLKLKKLIKEMKRDFK